MRITATVITILAIVGVSVGSCRFLAERPARPVPAVPIPLAYATEEVPTPDADTPMPAPTAMADGAVLILGAAGTFPTFETRDSELPVVGTESSPAEPSPQVTLDEESTAAEPQAPTAASQPAPVTLPKGGYASPGIGSPEAVALEEKTLDYLNWARARQGIQPYRMNPEMQALAREQALLYVQTREGTGQYPPADKISAATKARRWFFEDGGGPDPSLWLRWSYAEMESGYSLRYEPFYRNPKGSDIGIAFAFYSGKGAFGQAGGSIVVVVWNGEWDG